MAFNILIDSFRPTTHTNSFSLFYFWSIRMPFLVCFRKYSKSRLFLCAYLFVTLTITGLCKLNLIILAHLPVDSISMSRMSPLKLALIGIHVGSLSGMAMDTRWNFGSVEGNRSFVIDFNRVRSSSGEWTATHTDVHTGLGASNPLCWLMTKKMGFSADLPPSLVLFLKDRVNKPR